MALQKVLTTSPGVQLNILTYQYDYYMMMYGIFITPTICPGRLFVRDNEKTEQRNTEL